MGFQNRIPGPIILIILVIKNLILSNYTQGVCLNLVAEEAGDDDLGDVGSMGTPGAHTHHSQNSPT